MRKFRRRRPRVAWLPVFGAAPVPEATAGPAAGISAEIDLDFNVAQDEVVWDSFALTFDTSQSAVETQASPTDRTLRDIVAGNEYRLRRIVGKAFVWTSNDVQGASVLPAIDCAFGIIVSHTDDDGFPRTNFDEVNPLAQDSMEDPWIWRRRWLLQPGDSLSHGVWTNPATTTTETQPKFWGFPASNVRYGSVQDGPHIDAKTARVIHRNERLYGVFAARRLYAGGAVAICDTKAHLLLDYRLLGSLRGSSYGNRGNTAR